MKTLIYWPSDELEPVGGPRGYLYNLSIGLGQRSDICFLPPANCNEATGAGKLKSMLSKVSSLRDLHLLLKLSLMCSRTAVPCVDFSQFDAVHFHSTLNLYECREALERYNGICILTSHTPCAPHEEFYSWIQGERVRKIARTRAKLDSIDAFAFERADYVFFPCEEAKEPYFNTWKAFSKINESLRCLYLPTGISGCTAKTGRAEIRARYGISENAFVVSFAGRHSEVKGFSDLVRFGVDDLAIHPSDYFLIAGTEAPVKGLRHDRWIEAGWTNDPHSLISASDVFVLPNRETYFDLVFLEVLSLGVPIVATRTGGNKYFERFNCPGVKLYSNDNELNEALEYLRSIGEDGRRKIGAMNRKLFESRFTASRFAEAYTGALGRIEKEALL